MQLNIYGYQITTEKISRYSIYTLPRNAGYHIILFEKSLLCKLTHLLIYAINIIIRRTNEQTREYKEREDKEKGEGG